MRPFITDQQITGLYEQSQEYLFGAGCGYYCDRMTGNGYGNGLHQWAGTGDGFSRGAPSDAVHCIYPSTIALICNVVLPDE